jgi:hypothetical protein
MSVQFVVAPRHDLRIAVGNLDKSRFLTFRIKEVPAGIELSGCFIGSIDDCGDRSLCLGLYEFASRTITTDG